MTHVARRWLGIFAVTIQEENEFELWSLKQSAFSLVTNLRKKSFFGEDNFKLLIVEVENIIFIYKGKKMKHGSD